ncbi:MAG: diacylglycerol kinase family protein [Firmicutes bacterium]|nr:diacylglycerol kinase family protein [Bacillota bacterium]
MRWASAVKNSSLRESFKYAFLGLTEALRSERNLRIHLGAGAAVLVLGFSYGLTFLEWLGLVVAIGLVFTAELLNTAIETVLDLVSPKLHPLAARAKNVAAAAVLVAVFTAVIIGIIIFGPRIW